jgi:hypothetical protein
MPLTVGARAAIAAASAWGVPGGPVNPRERIRSSETITHPTGGLGRHAGRAFLLSSSADIMNLAFVSEDSVIAPIPSALAICSLHDSNPATD